MQETPPMLLDYNNSVVIIVFNLLKMIQIITKFRDY